ncbi:hypothetical protein GA0115256_118135 [Streptomyces sp. DconLS]|nr:hypothetical protein GA0115256_118135 [Streptomyces sp. DconLS]
MYRSGQAWSTRAYATRDTTAMQAVVPTPQTAAARPGTRTIQETIRNSAAVLKSSITMPMSSSDGSNQA